MIENDAGGRVRGGDMQLAVNQGFMTGINVNSTKTQLFPKFPADRAALQLPALLADPSNFIPAAHRANLARWLVDFAGRAG